MISASLSALCQQRFGLSSATSFSFRQQMWTVRQKKAGQAFAIWVFIIAGIIVLGGAYITMNGPCSIDALMQCSR